MMSRAAVLAVMLILPLATPVLARPLERELPLRRNACWERSYDAAHLATHPRQKVTQVRLLHQPPLDNSTPGQIYLQLHFNLRERKTDSNYDYAYGGFCRASGQTVRCESEWAGGVFHVVRGPNGTLDVRNGGLIANPSNYDSEDIADNAVKLPAKPDDGTWRLSPATGECRVE